MPRVKGYSPGLSGPPSEGESDTSGARNAPRFQIGGKAVAQRDHHKNPHHYKLDGLHVSPVFPHPEPGQDGGAEKKESQNFMPQAVQRLNRRRHYMFDETSGIFRRRNPLLRRMARHLAGYTPRRADLVVIHSFMLSGHAEMLVRPGRHLYNQENRRKKSGNVWTRSCIL